MKNISWNTTKTADGFAFKVYEIVGHTEPTAAGSFAEFITLKTGVSRSRAKAKGLAQRWVRYLKAVA